MPKIFLSPSTQDYNSYVNGGNEALYANLIADAMEPYLRASGIDFTRNDPNGNVSTSIAASNAGNYDLHLAIHSNAAPIWQACFEAPMSTTIATVHAAARLPKSSLTI